MSNSSQAVCYLGNGEISADAVQCDITGAINTCCPPGNVCLSNGMCFGTQTTGDYFKYTRDACVDQSGAGCLPNCASQQYNQGAGDSICGNQFTGFCCFEDHASGECNCDSGENAFTLPYGTPVSTIGILAPSDATELAVSMTTISSLLNRGITEGLLPAPTSTNLATSASHAFTSTTYSTSGRSSSLPSASDSDSSQSAQKSGQLTTGVQVGIAMGVVLLVIAISLTGFMVFRARRRTSMKFPADQNMYQKAELATDGSEVQRWRGPPAELPGTLHPWSRNTAVELPT